MTVDEVFPVAVYAAMFGGTLGGQFLGMGVDAFVLGQRVVWIPFLCSVLLEALLGERFGSSRMGHAFTARERVRLSLHYSIGLAALSIPLIGWLAASHATPEQLASSGVSSHSLITVGAAVLAGLILYTMLRTGLMTLFARRSR